MSWVSLFPVLQQTGRKASLKPQPPARLGAVPTASAHVWRQGRALHTPISWGAVLSCAELQHLCVRAQSWGNTKQTTICNTRSRVERIPHNKRGWGRTCKQDSGPEALVVYTNDFQTHGNAKQQLPHGAVHFTFVFAVLFQDKSGTKNSSGRIVIFFHKEV